MNIFAWILLIISSLSCLINATQIIGESFAPPSPIYFDKLIMAILSGATAIFMANYLLLIHWIPK